MYGIEQLGRPGIYLARRFGRLGVLFRGGLRCFPLVTAGRI